MLRNIELFWPNINSPQNMVLSRCLVLMILTRKFLIWIWQKLKNMWKMVLNILILCFVFSEKIQNNFSSSNKEGDFLISIVSMSPKSYLEFLLSAIVSFPDSLEISEIEDHIWILLTVQAHASDMGMIIGKSGKTVDSLRVLLHIFGLKHWKRVSLKLLEEKK